MPNTQQVPGKVTLAVCEDIITREQHGLRKYGVTVDRTDLTIDQWLQHAYEEALDHAVYLKRILMYKTLKGD